MLWLLSFASMTAIVGALGRAAGHDPAPHDDAALREADLLTNLRELVPPGLLESGSDELGADVALAEVLLVHRGARVEGYSRARSELEGIRCAN